RAAQPFQRRSFGSNCGRFGRNDGCRMATHDAPAPDDESSPVEIPIDGVLDLHTFHPREVNDLVPHYLEVCREKGILEVRVIHGKGTGTLRRTVHAILGRLPW